MANRARERNGNCCMLSKVSIGRTKTGRHSDGGKLVKILVDPKFGALQGSLQSQA